MKFKWIRSNIHSIRFLLSLAVIGLIIGIIYFYNQNADIQTGVVNKISSLISNNDLNIILFHFGIISILILLSLIIIGLPIGVFYYFYEFLSIGYLIGLFIKYKGINGLIFGCLFVIINKLLFLAILSYFLVNMVNYIRECIKYYKYSKNDLIRGYLFKCFFALFVILINDIIIYFLGNKLLSLFIFLI